MKTRKLIFSFVCAAASLLFLSGSSVMGLTEGQKILKAKRGAQLDAYRLLSEMIKGLKITSNSYVRDFVTENDEVRSQFDDFIKGAKVMGEPRFIKEQDGSTTAEVDVMVTLEQVMQGLAKMSYQSASGDEPIDFTYMKKYTRQKEFIATGHSNTLRPEPVDAGEEYGGQQRGRKYGSWREAPTAGMPGWENITAQGRLKAERAAVTDARRNLAETIEGLRISGDTYVRDFVTESDEIRTSMDAFIKGVKQISPYRYYDDGIVEVDVQVTIQDVVRELETRRQHLVERGHRWRRDIFRTVKFDKIVGWSDKKIIKAKGNGTVSEYDYYDSRSGREQSGAGVMPSWASRTVSATGTGIPREGDEGPSAKIKAERAAEMDAKRNLVEQVYGVNIDSTTTVRDFVLQHDEINSDVTAFLANAKKVGEPVYKSDGSVEVTVEMPLEGLWRIIDRRRE